jgi:hypothetical protein
MTMRLRITARGTLRGVVALAVALAAAAAACYAGVLVLAAILFAREESRWWPVYVYDDGETDMSDSRRRLIDIYAHEPLNLGRWLGFALLIAAAYAITVWGLWLVVRALLSVRDRRGSGRPLPMLESIAGSVFVWGIVALSAYSLGIFVWDWVEWWNDLNAGPILAYDPKPEPNPAYDPRQIPLGIVAFSAIGALPLAVRAALRKRGTLQRSEEHG